MVVNTADIIPNPFLDEISGKDAYINHGVFLNNLVWAERRHFFHRESVLLSRQKVENNAHLQGPLLQLQGLLHNFNLKN